MVSPTLRTSQKTETIIKNNVQSERTIDATEAANQKNPNITASPQT